MLGRNKMEFNQATIKQIVQEWLDRRLVNCNVEVSQVSQDRDVFEVIVLEKSKENLLDE